LLDAVMAYAAGTEAAILDLGCNCGRHLNALYQAGYRDLTGVDAMAGALDVFRREFTDAAACSKLSHDLFQRFLSRQQDRSYDIVYSHGATLELVHPSFDIVRHICRITRRHVVLFLNEHAHAYPRFWIYEFRRRGFYLVDALRPAGQLSSMDLAASLLVFQRIER
jgi:SAM-dependent methyltransferase